MSAGLPRIGDWRPPLSNSEARCLLCGAVPAGLVHIQVSWFRGDDEVVRCCRPCSRKSDAAERLLRCLPRGQATGGGRETGP